MKIKAVMMALSIVCSFVATIGAVSAFPGYPRPSNEVKPPEAGRPFKQFLPLPPDQA